MGIEHAMMGVIIFTGMIALWALNNWHVRKMERLFSEHRERMAEIMAPLYAEDEETRDEAV